MAIKIQNHTDKVLFEISFLSYMPVSISTQVQSTQILQKKVSISIVLFKRLSLFEIIFFYGSKISKLITKKILTLYLTKLEDNLIKKYF